MVNEPAIDYGEEAKKRKEWRASLSPEEEKRLRETMHDIFTDTSLYMEHTAHNYTKIDWLKRHSPYLNHEWTDHMQKVVNEYYDNTLIKFNMLNSINLKDREFIILPAKSASMIRRLKVSKIDHISHFVERFDIKKQGTQLYHSIGLIEWEKMPHITQQMLNPKLMAKEEYRVEFNNRLLAATTGFDLCFDIDCLDYWHVQLLVDYMRKHKVYPLMMFSGKKGFHIRIPWEWISEAYPELLAIDAPEMFKRVAHAILHVSEAPMKIDNMFYHTRIIKLPYSVSSVGLVALPLTYKQLIDFDIDMCLPENVLQMYPLKNRCFPIENETKPDSIRKLFEHAMKNTTDKELQSDLFMRLQSGGKWVEKGK